MGGRILREGAATYAAFEGIPKPTLLHPNEDSSVGEEVGEIENQIEMA